MRFILLFLIACGGPIVDTASERESLRHDVEFLIEDGIAVLNVRRAYRGIEGELDLTLPIPSASAVDRFRFGHNDRWYQGELLESEAAAERYDLLSGLAGEEGHASAGAPPPALLAWEHGNAVRLKAHPIAPEDVVEIEYRVILSTCHAEGRALFDYPLEDAPSFFGPGVVRDPYEDESFESACDASASILSDERAVIELEALAEPAMTYAVQSLGARTAVRIAIDAPAELAPIPERPLILFVVDGSHSQDDAGLADQLAWAKAYLAWVPDADVEVIVFRRWASRLFERLVPAAGFEDAIASLPAESVALGNGSFLDRGISLATSLADRHRETRIVVTSDLSLRNAFDRDAVRSELGPSIMHVLRRDGPVEGDASLSKYGDEDYGVLAFATGGLNGSLSGDPKSLNTIEVVEELVHPIRWEQVELQGVDVVHDVVLERGAHLRVTALLDVAAPDRIEVRASLWSRELRIPLDRSNVVEAAMPAILIAAAPGLTDEETLSIAQRGGVVSSMTSYLAELGGVDPLSPSGEILEGIGGMGLSTVSSCGCGCCGSHGLGYRIESGLLREQVRALADACGATDATGWIELTEDEIADVGVEASAGVECLLEAIWAMRAPEEYDNSGRTTLSF